MVSIRRRRPGRPAAAHCQPRVQEQTALALAIPINAHEREGGCDGNVLENVPLTLAATERESGCDGRRRSKRTRKPSSRFPSSLFHLAPAACKGKTRFKMAGNNRRQKNGPLTLRVKSSSFKGVSLFKRTKRWGAQIWNSKKRKPISLGTSSTEEKAARAYDRAAIHFHKIGAQLNFKWDDYKGELPQLMEISEDDLTTMLRKQNAGEGSEYPVYPLLFKSCSLS